MTVRKNSKKKKALKMQYFCKPSECNGALELSSNVGHDTACPQTHQTTKRSFFDDFSHAVFSFCKLFTPLVTKAKYKEYIVTEVCRNNTKIKSLVEFILSDSTIRVEINWDAVFRFTRNY